MHAYQGVRGDSFSENFAYYFKSLHTNIEHEKEVKACVF